MRSFWGFYENSQYRVGCNGGVVYVYDLNNKELGKFKDLKYAYVGAFQPGSNVFVLKSTEGSLAVYDLDKIELIRKIVVTKNGAQDEGFAFSPDGKYFYNIEKPKTSLRTRLTVYRTSDYTAEKVLFEEEETMFMEALEFDRNTGEAYVLGFMRNADGVIDYGFIGRFDGERVYRIKRLERERYNYISAYKSWEQAGCTAKKLEWSRMKTYEERPPVALKQEYEK